MLSLKFLEKNLFHAFIFTSGVTSNPWLSLAVNASLQSLPPSLCGVLSVCLVFEITGLLQKREWPDGRDA